MKCFVVYREIIALIEILHVSLSSKPCSLIGHSKSLMFCHKKRSLEDAVSVVRERSALLQTCVQCANCDSKVNYRQNCSYSRLVQL